MISQPQKILVSVCHWDIGFSLELGLIGKLVKGRPSPKRRWSFFDFKVSG